MQINRLQEKEGAREAAQAELVHLRQEILLMGELQQKYRYKCSSNTQHFPFPMPPYSSKCV